MATNGFSHRRGERWYHTHFLSLPLCLPLSLHSLTHNHCVSFSILLSLPLCFFPKISFHLFSVSLTALHHKLETVDTKYALQQQEVGLLRERLKRSEEERKLAMERTQRLEKKQRDLLSSQQQRLEEQQQRLRRDRQRTPEKVCD